jgi:alcohol dehydrogenase
MLWSFATARSLVCGPGTGGRLIGNLLKGIGAVRVLVVTDPGVARARLLEDGLNAMRQAGLSAVVYDKTEEDPPERVVLEASQIARVLRSDTVVGFGGGSSMDVAKLVSLLASPRCQQALHEMYGVGACVGERLRLVQVPTTAGTGSEVTPISILTTGERQKKGVVSSQLLPDLSILDGELTATLPSHVAAATGRTARHRRCRTQKECRATFGRETRLPPLSRACLHTAHAPCVPS